MRGIWFSSVGVSMADYTMSPVAFGGPLDVWFERQWYDEPGVVVPSWVGPALAALEEELIFVVAGCLDFVGEVSRL